MTTSKFQFLDPYLVEMHFTENQSFDADNKEYEMQNDFNVKVHRNKNENAANVQLNLAVNKDNENAPFQLEITVASDFVWEDMGEEIVETMLNLNAPALLLGYMRPIVANITNASSFPVYNLPFVNFKE